MTLTIPEIAELSKNVMNEVSRAVVGKRHGLENIMAALLVPGGHVLLEDYPGLAKTLVANSFATALGMSFRRIQFTPDLLPGDILGGYVLNRQQNQFVLRQGPIFANLILADEINRASPKTQSALLEAMQEYQVTLEGETHRLPEPFVVIATQNPIEYEGTFPLPEAQLDRFIMKISLGYPSPEEEQAILRNRRERKKDPFELKAVINAETLLEMREGVEEVYLDPDLEKYIVQLVSKTRSHRNVAVGSSPRGALALLKLSRAYAALQGRDYVLPDDIKHFALAALAHRLILEPDLWTVKRAAGDLIQEIVNVLPVPVFKR